MNKPRELDETAAKFWDRHAKRLRDEGLLTPATFDSFVLLCRTFAVLQRHDPDNTADKMAVIKFIALSRQYQQLARGFGMNTDKPKVPQQGSEVDEFGIG